MFVLNMPLVAASREPQPSWTFIVYLDGDNSLDAFGPINLQQISNGLVEGAGVNVVVLMDRLNQPAYTYEVTSGQIKIIQSLGEVDMGNPATLSSFVTFAIQNYPADQYFLDVWDHGGGYTGACWDESSGNHLTPHDIEIALANAETTTSSKVDIVGFDACLMSMIEVCYEMKDVTDIVIGSEMLIPGYGWPYAQWMTYISSNPTVDVYTLSGELVHEYVAYYPKYKVQLSAVNEAEIPTIASSLTDLANSLKTNLAVYRRAISRARGSTQQNQVLGTQSALYHVDLQEFVTSINNDVPNTNVKQRCTQLMSKLQLAVFAEDHPSKLASLDKKQFGLTIYFPPNSRQYDVGYESAVPCFAQETTWVSFLKAYYSLA